MSSADKDDFYTEILIGFRRNGTESSIFGDADLAEKVREEDSRGQSFVTRACRITPTNVSLKVAGWLPTSFRRMMIGRCSWS
jgi:hypothetical protein